MIWQNVWLIDLFLGGRRVREALTAEETQRDTNVLEERSDQLARRPSMPHMPSGWHAQVAYSRSSRSNVPHQEEGHARGRDSSSSYVRPQRRMGQRFHSFLFPHYYSITKYILFILFYIYPLRSRSFVFGMAFDHWAQYRRE